METSAKHQPSCAALLLCGGSGARMLGLVDDKVLAPLAGKPVFAHSFDTFKRSGLVDTMVFVCRDDAQEKSIKSILADMNCTGLTIQWARGGKERQDSVFNGLSELSLLVEYVFIHDCARPLVRQESLAELHARVIEDKAVVLAHRVTDTIKKVPATKRTLRLRKLQDVPRSSLWGMETPQVFERELILEAYRRLRYDNKIVTDDTAAARLDGHKISLVENTHPNPKLTHPEDFGYVEYLLSRTTP